MARITVIGTGYLGLTHAVCLADLGDVHFLCVGTPQGPDGSADLSFLRAATDSLAPQLSRDCLVVGKSTVPAGTARQLRSRLRAMAPGADLAWNPEFLREGHAVRDSLAPDRFVFGVCDEPAVATWRCWRRRSATMSGSATGT
jgi:UDPglucose 6-dehydrogenase